MSIIGLMFPVVFIIVIGTFVMTAVKGLTEWNNNNNSPRLSVNATVVSKRADVSYHRHHHANGHNHTTRSTTYYVTFQVDSMDRMELKVSGNEYGMLVEGDCGVLTFQGTRYLGFERVY